MARHSNSKQTEQVEIWQWNCCSLRKKLANFTQFIESSPVSPDIICIQEVGKHQANLKGYVCYKNPEYPQIATFAKKDVALSISYAGNEPIQHHVITVWPRKRGRPKTVIVNVYSPPREKHDDFENILVHALGLLKGKDQLIFLGD